MGGRPLTCLNLIGFPSNQLGPEVLHGIVEGALSKITEAGAVLAGGHTTDDEEPKFGLSVTGVVHPEKYWRNAGAKPGDVLILTKPIGSGVLFNANLKGWVSDRALEECLEIITTLNRKAAEVLADLEVHAATDITGFGLAGHACEMAQASDVTVALDLTRLPLLPGAEQLARQGNRTRASTSNRAFSEPTMRIEGRPDPLNLEFAFDAQTSGGLLLSVPSEQARHCVDTARAAGAGAACVIGEVLEKQDRSLLLRG